jgi:hypothetical protein
MTIATNAAGQAAAAGLTPLTAGAVNISVEAAVQGQIVTAAITQVNVMTAAEAAAAAGATGAGSGGGAGAAGGGAAGGTGGGISATTIGIIGGVAAAGAVAATQVVGGGGDFYKGTFSMNVTLNFGNCNRQENYSGALVFELESTSGSINGHGEIKDAKAAVTATTCTGPIGVGPIGDGGWGMPAGPVTGTETSMKFESHDNVQSLTPGITLDRTFKFLGALSGSTITGEIDMVWISSQAGFPVTPMHTTTTLQKQ